VDAFIESLTRTIDFFDSAQKSANGDATDDDFVPFIWVKSVAHEEWQGI